jgi:hypothetical protein
MTSLSWLRVLFLPVVGMVLVVAYPNAFTPKDFTEYWSAAVVLAHKGDPYDGAQLLPIQQEVWAAQDQQRTSVKNPDAPPEERNKVVSLWTPPWTLPLYLPFGYATYDRSRFVWLGLQLLMVAISLEMLGRLYFPAHRSSEFDANRTGLQEMIFRLLPHLLALLFAPVFWMTNFGQNTGFLLLGLAGFIYFRQSWPFLAGCFVALTAVKPHLLAAFGVVLILDLFRRDGWKVLAAGVGMLIAGSFVAVAVNGQIFEQFVAAVRRPATPETVPLSDWQLPLIAYRVRHMIDPNQFWIQFLPCWIACLGLGAFKLWRGTRWNWLTMLPVAVLISCLTAPYGGWIFDLVVLLVPVISASYRMLAIRVSRIFVLALIVGYGILNLFGILIPNLQAPIWFTPVVAGIYGSIFWMKRPSAQSS